MTINNLPFTTNLVYALDLMVTINACSRSQWNAAYVVVMIRTHSVSSFAMGRKREYLDLTLNRVVG